MFNMINRVLNGKHKTEKIILLAIAIPFIITILNAIILTIFNFGTFVGTYVRYIFSFKWCVTMVGQQRISTASN